MNNFLQAHYKIAVAFGCLVSFASAEESDIIAAGMETAADASPLWSAFVNMCGTIAPFCGVICFLAPFPTIQQISRDKTVGNLPLLPYSSMIANGFVWVMYGLLKSLPAVWGSNAIGVLLGMYYFSNFAKHCSPTANSLPGTIQQHLKGTGAIILFNLVLAFSGINNSTDIIGKEGVFFCIIMFASPLSALKHVIESQSAASIPLPFTMASLVNCTAWSVLGWFSMNDFNIYFPNLLGLCCAVAQLLLKMMCGNGVKVLKEDLPK